MEESDNRTMPNFSRGPEIEITTRQDVELLKAMLSQNKIHNITTKTLERAIVMPRDMDSNQAEFPKIVETLMNNPYKQVKEAKKGRKGRKLDDDGGHGGGKMMRGSDGKMKGVP